MSRTLWDRRLPANRAYLLNCELLPGAPYVFACNGMREALDGADLVITGEGKMDCQTMMGKGPGTVITMAREKNVPVAAVCGVVESDFDWQQAGLFKAVAVSEGLSAAQAMDNDRTLMNVSLAVAKLVDDFAAFADGEKNLGTL